MHWIAIGISLLALWVAGAALYVTYQLTLYLVEEKKQKLAAAVQPPPKRKRRNEFS